MQLDFSLAACQVFVPHGTEGFVAPTVLIATVLAVLIATRPFVEWFKNVGFGATLVACLLANVAQFLVDQDMASASEWVSYVMIVLLACYVVGIVFVVVVYGCIARCVRLPALLQLNHHR